MARPRILQVLEATAGGTRRHLADLCLGLDPACFEWQVACATRRDPAFMEDVRLYRSRGIGVDLLDLKRRPDPLRDLSGAARLRQILLRGRHSLLHAHSAKAGLVARLAAAHLDLPVIYSPHAFPFMQAGVMGRLSWVAERILAPATTVLHAVSRAEARLAVESGLFPTERVALVENAVDVPALDRSLSVRRLPRRAGPAGPVFAFLGELRRQKDPLTFVRAAARAISLGSRARFLMPGQGPLRALVGQEIARLGLGGAVSFVPARGTLLELYAQADFGVLPSLWEGLPYTLLEAMALRMPVLAAGLPVFCDLLEGIAPELIFAPGDWTGLAARLLHWERAAPARVKAVGEAERAVVLANHGIEDWRERMTSLYREVVERGTVPPWLRQELKPGDRAPTSALRSVAR